MLGLPMNCDHEDRVKLYLTCLVLGIVAATFFSRIWDPDFFWHLATGRWIVQNMAVPVRDPFTPFFSGTDGEALILRCYWLAQACFHFVFALGGTFGLALLKSAIFVTIFALIFRYHQRRKTTYSLVLLSLLLLYENLLHFRGDRPNMFSFLFFAVLLYLLESKRWKFLPLLMLIWANAHGGYVLGDVVLGLYIGVLAVARRTELEKSAFAWGLSAVGASFMNPVGITALTAILKFEGSSHQQGILEFMSPIRIALEFHDYYLGYFLALLLGIGALFLCRNSVFWPQLTILFFSGFISVLHIRYIPFFVIAAAFFLPSIYSRINLPVRLGRCILYGSTALILIFFADDLVYGRAFSMGLEPARYPEQAAAFVEKSGVTGPLFCDDSWGGYLIWRLPESVVLNDTRALSEDVYFNNIKIMNAEPDWEQRLRALETKVIVTAAFNPISGLRNGLWKALAYSKDWRLAYADDVALVFLRNDIPFSGPRRSKGEERILSLNHALAQIQAVVDKYPQTPWHWGDLGEIHLLRGDIPAAVKAYRQALELAPGNDDYRIKVKILESR